MEEMTALTGQLASQHSPMNSEMSEIDIEVRDINSMDERIPVPSSRIREPEENTNCDVIEYPGTVQIDVTCIDNENQDKNEVSVMCDPKSMTDHEIESILTKSKDIYNAKSCFPTQMPPEILIDVEGIEEEDPIPCSIINNLPVPNQDAETLKQSTGCDNRRELERELERNDTDARKRAIDGSQILSTWTVKYSPKNSFESIDQLISKKRKLKGLPELEKPASASALLKARKEAMNRNEIAGILSPSSQTIPTTSFTCSTVSNSGSGILHDSQTSTQITSMATPSSSSHRLMDMALPVTPTPTPIHSHDIHKTELPEAPSPQKGMRLESLSPEENVLGYSEMRGLSHSLANYDPMPILELKEEDVMLHTSSMMPYPGTMPYMESICRKKTLPGLSSFTAPARFQIQALQGGRDLLGDNALDPILHMHDPPSLSQIYCGDNPSTSKVQVLPVHPNPELYPMSKIFEHDDSTSSTSHLRESMTRHEIEELALQGFHFLPDSHGKPCLVGISDDNNNVKDFGTHHMDHYVAANPGGTGSAMSHNEYHRKSLSSGRNPAEQGHSDEARSILKHNRHVKPQNFQHRGNERMTRSEDNKENSIPTSSGVQVLGSTWKVNMNKSHHGQSNLNPHPLLSSSNVPNLPSTPTEYHRTPHPIIAGNKYHRETPPDVDLDSSPGLPKYVLQSGGQVYYSTGGIPTGGSTMTHNVPGSSQMSSLINAQNKYSCLHSPSSLATPLSLNSSGSEDGLSPPDFMRNVSDSTPYNTPIDEGGASPNPLIPTAGQLNAALFRAKENLSDSDMDIGRQAHNAKERARRSRIKIACEHLRDLVPGMSMKTDKATVFEFAVQYIAFLRRYVGIEYDKEFLRQCSPY